MATGRSRGDRGVGHGTIRTVVGGDPPPVGGGGGGGGGGTGDTIPNPATTRRTTREPNKITRNESAADKERDIPLGLCLQGLKKLYENSWQNGRYYFVVAALGEGPIRSCTPRADRKALPLFSGSHTNPQATRYRSANTRVNVWVYDGSQASGFQETASGLFGFDPVGFNMTANADVIAAWEYLAFVVIRVEFVLESQTTIPDFTFVLEGYRDLYDPLDGTRKYSTNRALWIREVLTNTRWGLKQPASKIDDVSFLQARQDCAVSVFPARPLVAAVAAVTGTAGNPLGTFNYTYTRVNSTGVETLESPVSNTVAPASKQVTLTIPPGDALTSEFSVYRSGTGPDATRRRVGTLPGSAGGVFTDNVSGATWSGNPQARTVAPTEAGRYEGGGRLISAAALGRDWLNTLRASCLGVITVDNGKFQLQINKALPGGYVPLVYSEVHGAGGLAKPNVESRGVVWGRKKRHELPDEVAVKGVDWQNDYAPLLVVKRRPGATGSKRFTYNLDDVPDTAYAGRVATTILNLSWDDAFFNIPVDRSGIATIPWDVVAFYGSGLAGQLVRVRQVQGRGEGFWLRGTEYQAGSYSDVVQAVDAPLLSGTSGFADVAPPDISPGSVTWAEELYQPATGNGIWATRGVLGIAIPDSSNIEAVEVWLSVNGGTSRPWLTMTTTSAVTPPLYEVGTYTLTFYTISSTKRRSAGVAVPVPVVGVTGIPPEPCDMDLGSFAAAPMTFAFEAARLRVEPIFGGSAWTADAGLSGFTAAAVNNSVLNVTAFTAVAPDITAVNVADALPFGAFPVNYRNSVFSKVVVLDGTWSQVTFPILSTAGSHRYYRVKWGSGGTGALVLDAGVAKAFREVRITYQTASPGVVSEVQFIEWGAVDPKVTHYRLYDTSVTPNLRFGQPIPASALPTAAAPLHIEGLTERIASVWDNNGSVAVSLRLAAVSASGAESVGYTCGLVSAFAAAGLDDVQTYGKMGLGVSVPLAISRFDVATNTRGQAHIALTGQEFYQASNTDTEGPVVVAGVNRTSNRQIWMMDSAALAQNTTNKTLYFYINNGEIGARATNGSGANLLPLRFSGSTITRNASPAAADDSTELATTAWVRGVAAYLKGSTAQDLPNVPAQGDSSVSFTLTGAIANSGVLVVPTTDVSPLTFNGRVISTNNITIDLHNHSAAAVNLGTITFMVWLFKP